MTYQYVRPQITEIERFQLLQEAKQKIHQSNHQRIIFVYQLMVVTLQLRDEVNSLRKAMGLDPLIELDWKVE